MSSLAEQRSRGERPSSRLRPVDGLRGFAAMWVLLFHAYKGTSVDFSPIPGLDLFLNNGYFGVSLFLVLSGFCLYLPFANGHSQRFQVREFWRRRCRRLLPAYYAAIFFAIAVKMSGYALIHADYYSPPELLWQMAAHLTFTFTLFPDTFYALNGAFWSLGLEWQLYLVLPALIWGAGRFGFVRTLAVALACHAAYSVLVHAGMLAGVLPTDTLIAYAVLPNFFLGRWAEFLLGMAAAELYARNAFARLARPALVMAGVLLPVAIAAGFESWPVQQLLTGCIFSAILGASIAPGTRLGSILASRPMVGLGTISYGIYLLHAPLISAMAGLTTANLQLPAAIAFGMTLCVAPVVLGLSWILYVWVERPFITGQYSALLRAMAGRAWIAMPRFQAGSVRTDPLPLLTAERDQ